MTGAERGTPSPAPVAAASTATCVTILLLFCAWPIVNFANDNREQLSRADYGFLATAFIVTVAVVMAAFAALGWIAGAPRRVRLVAALVAAVVLFYNYHLVFAALVEGFAFVRLTRGENYAYLAILVGVPLLVWFLPSGRIAAQALLVAAIALFAMPAAGLAAHAMSDAKGPAVHAGAEAARGSGARIKPNIYYLMTDGYGRADQLASRLGYDNSAFVDYLKGRGFYVADQAYANYPMTYMSLPSSLAMDYLVTETTPKHTDRSSFYATIQGRNPVVERLRSYGYTYAHMASGVWDGSRCSGVEDVCLANSEEVVVAFFRMTPVSRLRRGESVTTPRSVEVALERLPSGRPTFLFAHIFSPHPPRTFEGDCALRTTRGESLVYWKPSGKNDYLRDIACTNRQLSGLIDRLLERDPQAIVLLHSDHGPAFGIDWSLPNDRWTRDAFDERFAILMALRLPSECSALPYPTLSPVNLFRVVFACLEGKPVERLADDSYITAYEKNERQDPVLKYRR
jgi:hypothetical protein